MPDQVREAESEREGECSAFAELLRLPRRCISRFEGGQESSYTQAEALDDLEDWLRVRPPTRKSR